MNFRRIAQRADYVPMAANAIGALDVALAELDRDADVAWEYNGLRQKRVARGLALPDNCTIYTPRGAVSAVFDGEYTNVRLFYPQCGDVIIRVAYRFIAATSVGDSGSAVMAPDGTLHGMHFWGDPGNRAAYAIPAFAVFRRGLFAFDIELQ
jgi:hypothetical protein